jgi:hypothetical protein
MGEMAARLRASEATIKLAQEIGQPSQWGSANGEWGMKDQAGCLSFPIPHSPFPIPQEGKYVFMFNIGEDLE